jgi:hypothetical protein
MRTSNLNHYALGGYVAAAMLVGCGGSQPPFGAPNAIPQARDRKEHSKPFKFTGAPQSFVVPKNVAPLRSPPAALVGLAETAPMATTLLRLDHIRLFLRALCQSCR